MTRAPAHVTEVLALLNRQRDALLRGEFAALEGLDAHLGRAMQRLVDVPVPPQDLTRLSKAAAHVARLLTAARTGVSQARSDRCNVAPLPLMTYDARGQQQAGPATETTLSRR